MFSRPGQPLGFKSQKSGTKVANIIEILSLPAGVLLLLPTNVVFTSDGATFLNLGGGNRVQSEAAVNFKQ